MAASLKLTILGLACLSMALAETVTDITACPATDLSVGASDVKKYECKKDSEWIKPKFTPDSVAYADAATKAETLTGDNTFTFTFTKATLTFSAVTTCPEDVSSDLECIQLKTYFGTSATSTAGSPIKIGSNGAAGLAEWKCTQTGNTVYYYFFIKFSTVTDATAAGDLKDAVDTFAAIIGDSSSDDDDDVAEIATMKPNAFQKFDSVDENTSTYYIKVSATESHKVFMSDETTITFTAGDYTAAFDGSIKSDPTAEAVCTDAVELLYKDEKSGSSDKDKSGSSNSSNQWFSSPTMLLFASFISLFK